FSRDWSSDVCSSDLFGHVARVVLPVLVASLETFGEPLLLLVEGYEHRHFHEGRAAAQHLALERVDLVVSSLPDALGNQRPHPRDQHVLVMGAVEDAQLATARKRLVDAPEEMVPFLLGGGDAERMVIDPLRIDLTDDVPDHPAFSRGVHTLEDEKDRPGVAGAPVREELLLEIGQDLAAFGEQSFAECLVP